MPQWKVWRILAADRASDLMTILAMTILGATCSYLIFKNTSLEREVKDLKEQIKHLNTK